VHEGAPRQLTDLRPPQAGRAPHTRAIAPQTVQKYNCYLKDRIQLDELFSTFDKDGAA
jgi:hypothetical protein